MKARLGVHSAIAASALVTLPASAGCTDALADFNTYMEQEEKRFLM